MRLLEEVIPSPFLTVRSFPDELYATTEAFDPSFHNHGNLFVLFIFFSPLTVNG